MSTRPTRLRPHHASGLVTLSLRTASAETFTVIHGGAEIDESLAGELLYAASDWAATAEIGVNARGRGGGRRGRGY